MIVERKLTLKHRLGSLVNRKRTLENRISDEMKRPAPDALRLQSLKRLRLRAKDEIAAIRIRLSRSGSGPLHPHAA